MDLSTPQDLPALVARAQSGDETAFDAIFDLFADSMYRYLVVRCGNPSLADELTSDLWVHVVKHLPAFRFLHPASEQAFEAWLYRIAKNLLDDVRHRSARVPVAPTDSPPSVELLLDNQVIMHEAEQRLGEVMDQLTPDEQEFVLFRFMEERPLADVALLTGWSEGMVKTVQYRALHTLAGLLGGQRRQYKEK